MLFVVLFAQWLLIKPDSLTFAGKFFYIYICRFIVKSQGMSLTHVRSIIAKPVDLPLPCP